MSPLPAPEPRPERFEGHDGRDCGDPHAETRALAPEQAARAVHDAIECIDAAVELLVYARTLRGAAHLRQARTLLEQALQRMTS